MAAKVSQHTHCISCRRPMVGRKRKDKAALLALDPNTVFHTSRGLCEACSSRERRAGNLLQKAIVAPTRPEWMSLGLGSCASVDPDLWYPEEGGTNSSTTARRICRSCPFSASCLEWALEAGEQWGIWSGTTPDQRKAMMAKRTAAA